MLSQSNIDIPTTLQLFKDRGIKVGFLVPTETGLRKSIMDASGSLRKLLDSLGIHRYEDQQQGPEYKRLVPTRLFAKGQLIDTKTSLYRPLTKSGDPRIWIYELSKYADSGDLLALASCKDTLVVINCSQCDLSYLLSKENALMQSMFPTVAVANSLVAKELLSKLVEIYTRGFVRTMRAGDTGVGYTLETLLGIQANSSRSPDYKGIELKAGRIGKQKTRQTTVFSQVPSWKRSNLKGSKDILEKRGRYSVEKGRNQLFHEISCIKPNSYNLQLEIDDSGEELHQIHMAQEGDNVKKDYDVIWMMEKLASRVLEKHEETMWVSAETRGLRTTEEFRYCHVKHTRGVDTAALALLLEAGHMTVHYLIKQLPTGAAKDQGYLFKMAPRYLPILFDDTQSYDLSQL